MKKYYFNIDDMHNAQLAYPTIYFQPLCNNVYCCGKLTLSCTITNIIDGSIVEKMVLCPKCAEQQVLTLKKQ